MKNRQNRTEHIFIDIKLRPLTGSVRAKRTTGQKWVIFDEQEQIENGPFG